MEYDGAVYNPTASIIAALQEHRKETGSITGFSGGEDMDKSEAMFLACDVLLPAATENVITPRTPTACAARFSARAPTAPPRPLADEILADKKVFVIPDILANAGGVTVSYFEWVQDRQGFFWNEQLVNQRLEEIMVESFDAVVEYAQAHNVNNRIAAYMLALDRVATPSSCEASTRSTTHVATDPRCPFDTRVRRLPAKHPAIRHHGPSTSIPLHPDPILRPKPPLGCPLLRFLRVPRRGTN